MDIKLYELIGKEDFTSMLKGMPLSYDVIGHSAIKSVGTYWESSGMEWNTDKLKALSPTKLLEIYFILKKGKEIT